jgi:hypothetical protein
MACGVSIRRPLADFHDLTDHAASIEGELRRVAIESPLGPYGVLFLCKFQGLRVWYIFTGRTRCCVLDVSRNEILGEVFNPDV